METFIMTAENSTGYINITSLSPKDDIMDLNTKINLVYRPLILTLGTVGNILSLVTMTHGPLKKVSTCFYLAILSFAGKIFQIYSDLYLGTHH